MAYQKTNWETGMVISSDGLNNLEDGVSDISSDLNILTSKLDLPDIKQGSYDLNIINNNRIVNLSNLLTYNLAQEIITDPRTGWRYAFWHVTGTTTDTEDLAIVELDQFARIRSTMKVMHGVNRPSWLHGQFCQFNYYNSDESKVEFLIGGPGESVILDYQPDVTVNYDDLTVFLTVNEKSSYTQAVSFDQNLVFSAYGSTPETGTYQWNFGKYSLDKSTGQLTFVNSYTYKFEMSDKYIAQGVSAAPEDAYLHNGGNGTLIFCTAGIMWNGVKGEQSLRIFLINEEGISEYANIQKLYNAAYMSTSNNQRFSDSISHRSENGVEMDISYSEIEGSSQTKIDGQWVMTTNLVYANDTNILNGNSYDQRSMYQVQLGFGNQENLDKLRNIGKPKQRGYINVESSTQNLYTVTQPGIYNISPTLLPNLLDTPYIFRQGNGVQVVGGDGIETIILTVSSKGVYDRINQKLEIIPYSSTNNVNYVFNRDVKTNRNFGQSNNYDVGRWEFLKNDNIGAWTPLPIITNANLATLPGYSRYITTSNISSFFAGTNNPPTNPGLFEVDLTGLLIENTNTTVRIKQRFSDWVSPYGIYERIITVNVEPYNPIFKTGIGGGYPSIKSSTDWYKI